jgi:hypothetical protein
MVDWVTTTGISLASLPRFVTSYTKYRIDAELKIQITATVVFIAHLKIA